MTFIQLTDVDLIYGSAGSNPGEGTLAVSSANLDIAHGEFLALVGPSGCGKSTLLKLIAGLVRPNRGSVKVDNEEVLRPLKTVGMAFQNATLLPWMSVLENVALPLRVGGGKADETFVRSLLAMVGLAGFADKYPYELSGGMQQRAAICRALVRDPKVLLMDEPFGALDALTRERMNVELQRIWQASRKTVLLITHSIAESVFLGDRVVVMSPRPGRILEDFRIDLPRPRNFAETTGDPEYLRLTREIRAVLDATAGEDAA